MGREEAASGPHGSRMILARGRTQVKRGAAAYQGERASVARFCYGSCFVRSPLKVASTAAAKLQIVSSLSWGRWLNASRNPYVFGSPGPPIFLRPAHSKGRKSP